MMHITIAYESILEVKNRNEKDMSKRELFILGNKKNLFILKKVTIKYWKINKIEINCVYYILI